MSSPVELSKPIPRPTSGIAADVLNGLTGVPRRLPPRLFYDEAGSALFEQITELPEYYLTRSETSLFERHGAEIAAELSGPLTVIELGAGTARKTLLLLRALVHRGIARSFVPVDVSGAALEVAASQARAALPELPVTPLVGRYRSALRELARRPGKKLVLFIGSSIGNFEPDEALELLRDVRAGLSPGDGLLLGTDLVKPRSILLPAYDDAQGVTARFNKNVLARINRELGASFDLTAFRHVALWNERESRIELYLESTRDQEVTIPALGLTLTLARGERIHTEHSYKFSLPQVSALLSAASFRRQRTWTDDRGWFAEHLAFAR